MNHRGYSQREAGRRRKSKTWVGRTMGRTVICRKCNSSIPAGSLGFTRTNETDYAEWHCETCVT